MSENKNPLGRRDFIRRVALGTAGIASAGSGSTPTTESRSSNPADGYTPAAEDAMAIKQYILRENKRLNAFSGQYGVDTVANRYVAFPAESNIWGAVVEASSDLVSNGVLRTSVDRSDDLELRVSFTGSDDQIRFQNRGRAAIPGSHNQNPDSLGGVAISQNQAILPLADLNGFGKALFGPMYVNLVTQLAGYIENQDPGK